MESRFLFPNKFARDRVDFGQILTVTVRLGRQRVARGRSDSIVHSLLGRVPHRVFVRFAPIGRRGDRLWARAEARADTRAPGQQIIAHLCRQLVEINVKMRVSENRAQPVLR